MNLYDKDDGFKQFTLYEVNAALPRVIKVTEKIVERLEAVKEKYGVKEDSELEKAEARLQEEISDILNNWAQEIVELGGYPKGYFTVDFKSTVPDTLFCWTRGEQHITHTHKIHESFKDRIPIRNEPDIGFEGHLN